MASYLALVLLLLVAYLTALIWSVVDVRRRLWLGLVAVGLAAVIVVVNLIGRYWLAAGLWSVNAALATVTYLYGRRRRAALQVIDKVNAEMAAWAISSMKRPPEGSRDA